MLGRELGRMLLLVGLLVGSCNCSKADDDPGRAGKTKRPSPATTTAPMKRAPANDADTTVVVDDDVNDLMDDDDDDADALNLAHGTSGTVARVPGDCEPTIHTELELRLDCAGWTVQLSWIAMATAPGDLLAAASAALPTRKRRVISKTPVKKGVVLLTDRPDGTRAYEGWFHRGDKLIFLEARAARSKFAPLAKKLEAVATDFVKRNLTPKKRATRAP